MSNKKFLVSWINGEDIGLYEAEDADGAILAAVKDAGYVSLERARDFIYDEKGYLKIGAEEVATIKTINEKGIAQIKEWLKKNHKSGHNFGPDQLRAWAAQAEFQLSEGNAPCIEIKSYESLRGCTQEFEIDSDGVDSREIIE